MNYINFRRNGNGNGIWKSAKLTTVLPLDATGCQNFSSINWQVTLISLSIESLNLWQILEKSFSFFLDKEREPCVIDCVVVMLIAKWLVLFLAFNCLLCFQCFAPCEVVVLDCWYKQCTTRSEHHDDKALWLLLWSRNVSILSSCSACLVEMPIEYASAIYWN